MNFLGRPQTFRPISSVSCRCLSRDTRCWTLTKRSWTITNELCQMIYSVWWWYTTACTSVLRMISELAEQTFILRVWENGGTSTCASCASCFFCYQPVELYFCMSVLGYLHLHPCLQFVTPFNQLKISPHTIDFPFPLLPPTINTQSSF